MNVFKRPYRLKQSAHTVQGRWAQVGAGSEAGAIGGQREFNIQSSVFGNKRETQLLLIDISHHDGIINPG